MREGCPQRKLHQPSACSTGQAGQAMGMPGGHQPEPPPAPLPALRCLSDGREPAAPAHAAPHSWPPHAPTGRAATQPSTCTWPMLPRHPWGRMEDAGTTRPASSNRYCPARATRTWGVRQGLPLFLLPGRSPPAPLSGSAVATEGPLPGDEALDLLDPRSGHPAQPRWPAAAGTGLAAAPVLSRRQPAHWHQASVAALAGLAGAGGSECRPVQSVQTHASNTQREMEMEATCRRAGAMPRARHCPHHRPLKVRKTLRPTWRWSHTQLRDTFLAKTRPGLTAALQGCVLQRQMSTILPNLCLNSVMPELPCSPSPGKHAPCSDQVPLLGCTAACLEMGLSCCFALVGRPWEKSQYK